MRRYILTLILTCLCTLSWGQKISTQAFSVRKITYNSKDQVEPISGIFVDINNVKLRSDNQGQFVANIPVNKDFSFHIKSIHAPGYIVSIPEDLSQKLYLSSNPIFIVLADIDAVKRERSRIEAANKRAIAEYEAKINSEIEKNDALLRTLATKDQEYAQIAAELDRAKQELRQFLDHKLLWEQKVDSLATTLSLVDFQTLPTNEQQRIEGEKNGEWMNALIKDVLKELDAQVTSDMESIIDKFQAYLNNMARDYEDKYIKAGSSLIPYFAQSYSDFAYDCVSKEFDNGDRLGMDLIIYKSLEDKFGDMLGEHIRASTAKWRGLIDDEQTSQTTYQQKGKSMKEAEEEFLHWALYPEREDLLRDIKGSYQLVYDYSEFLKIFENIHPEFVNLCQNIANKYREMYTAYSDDKILSINSDEWFYLSNNIVEDIYSQEFCRESSIYYDFINKIVEIVAQGVVNELRVRNNNLIDAQKRVAYDAKLDHIHKGLKSIDQEEKCSLFLEWEQSKYADSERAEYEKLKAEYPDYFSFLEKLVLQFMAPIKEKYSSDKALYVWCSTMENDVNNYCWRPFRNNINYLEHIEGVKGSDNKCFDIVRAIINIEKSKLVDEHNRLIKEAEKENDKKKFKTIDCLKTSNVIFKSETDVIKFLATYKFTDDDVNRMSIWYDEEITKQHNTYNYYFNIDSYTIVEWSGKHAKLNLMLMGNPVDVSIDIDDEMAIYTEVWSHVTKRFRIDAK